jgi:hypothetical protein
VEVVDTVTEMMTVDIGVVMSDGAMLRHPVGNPKRKVLLSTAANFPQL